MKPISSNKEKDSSKKVYTILTKVDTTQLEKDFLKKSPEEQKKLRDTCNNTFIDSK